MVSFIHDIRTLDLQDAIVSETIIGRAFWVAAGDRTRPRDGQDTLNVLLKYETDIEPRCPDLHLRRQGLPSERLSVSAMRENLHRFFRRSGVAGFRVCAGRKHRRMSRRRRCRLCRSGHPGDTFLLTWQDPGRKAGAWRVPVDLFFDQPEFHKTNPRRKRRRIRRAEPKRLRAAGEWAAGEGLGPLRRSVVTGSQRMPPPWPGRERRLLSDIRYFTNAASSRPHPRPEGIQRLRDDLDALVASIQHPERWRRTAGAADAYATPVRSVLLYGRGWKLENLRNGFWQRAAVPDRAATGRADARLIRQIARRCVSATASRTTTAPRNLDVRGPSGDAAWAACLLTAWKRRNATGQIVASATSPLGGAGLRFLPAADPQPS